MLFLLLQTADAVTFFSSFLGRRKRVFEVFEIGIRIRIVEIAACLLFDDKWHQTNVFAENFSFII